MSIKVKRRQVLHYGVRRMSRGLVISGLVWSIQVCSGQVSLGQVRPF